MELFNVDIFVFILFLVITLFLGLHTSSGVNNLKSFAIGNKDFNTISITSTLVATFSSGCMFNSYIVETYNNGLYFLLVGLSEILGLLFLGWYFAPRMQRFIGKMSIADAMGDLYGNKIRIITIICGVVCAAGIIALQFKVAGLVFEYVFNLKPFYGVLIAGVIVTLYSAFGGIKSVVYTDILQGITFLFIIPLFAFYVFNTDITLEQVLNTINTNENFSIENVLDIGNPKSWKYAILFVYYFIPIFNPSFFQRITIARNWQQVRTSFYITAFIAIFLLISIAWLALVLLTQNPNVETHQIIKVLVYEAIPSGWKGFLLLGVLAMIMSTADSYINSSAVLMVYDSCKSFNIKLKDDLLVARIASLVIGIVAIFMSLKQGTIFEMGLFFLGFYFPIVVPSFIMAIVGYQTPYQNAVLGGMFAGGSFMLIWNVLDITVCDPSVFAMLANVIVLYVMHNYYKHKRLQSNKLELLHQLIKSQKVKP